MEQDGSDEEQQVTLDWDEPEEEMPVELTYIWVKTGKGEQKLDLKNILKEIPRFDGLPGSAPVNNHRLDGMNKRDKLERSWQQSLLHSLRMLVQAYKLLQAGKSALAQTINQQLFQLIIKLYYKIEGQRKESSIPGCVTSSQDVLFQKEEVQAANLASKVNRTGRGGRVVFQPYRGGRGAYSHGPRAFGYRGAGYGNGSGKSWTSIHGKGQWRGSGSGKGKAPYKWPVTGMRREHSPPPSQVPPSPEPECFLQEPEGQVDLVGIKCHDGSKRVSKAWCPETSESM